MSVNHDSEKWFCKSALFSKNVSTVKGILGILSIYISSQLFTHFYVGKNTSQFNLKTKPRNYHQDWRKTVFLGVKIRQVGNLMFSLKNKKGTSLMVQWLRLHTSNAGGAGSSSGWGTKFPHTAWHRQEIKQTLIFF